MIIKALLAKKVTWMVALSLLAGADARMTNRSHCRGGYEQDPMVRPFVGTPATYLVTQTDVAIADVLLLTHPHAKITKIVVPLAAASHVEGVVSNLVYKPPPKTCTQPAEGPSSAQTCNPITPPALSVLAGQDQWRTPLPEVNVKAGDSHLSSPSSPAR